MLLIRNWSVTRICHASPADKQITDEIKQYFEANPNENVYVGVFGIGGNAKVSPSPPHLSQTNSQILAAASTIGKTLSKAIYVFSPDEETGKVAHLNYVPKEILSSKKLDAKIWLGEVSKVIGGKVSPVYYIVEDTISDDTREVEGTIVLLESEARGERSTRLSPRLCECTRRRSRLEYGVNACIHVTRVYTDLRSPSGAQTGTPSARAILLTTSRSMCWLVA